MLSGSSRTQTLLPNLKGLLTTPTNYALQYRELSFSRRISFEYRFESFVGGFSSPKVGLTGNEEESRSKLQKHEGVGTLKA